MKQYQKNQWDQQYSNTNQTIAWKTHSNELKTVPERFYKVNLFRSFFMINWSLARDGINDDIVGTEDISVMIEEVNWIPNERQLLLAVWM